MASNHLNKLAVSQSDLSSATVISNVMEGADQATSFMYEVDYEDITIEDEQEIPFKAIHNITSIGLVRQGVNLDFLNDPEQKAKVAAIGHDMALISLEDVRIEVLDHPDSGNFWRFNINKASLPFRERNSGRRGAGLHVGSNLLSVFSFTDTSEDGVADGYASTFNSTFSNGVQTLEAANDGTIKSFDFADIFFPFVGEELSFSLDANSLTDGGHSLSLEIRFYDDTDQLISTEATPFSSIGRKFVKSDIPTGTVNVSVAVTADGSGAGSATVLDITDLALRVDGKTEYSIF